MEIATPITQQNSIPTVAEVRRQIDRIAASAGFRNSDPIRLVFLYLAQQAIECPGQTLKEHQIATSALGRSADFDPKVDSSIRVIVTRLRGRLAEYYTHEGSNDPILADIPKGAYVLSFSFRSAPTPSFGAATAAHLPLSPSVSRRSKSRLMLWVLAAAAILALPIISFLLGRISLSPRKAPELAAFWEGFLENGDPMIVFSNPIFQGTPETGMHLLDPSAFRSDDTNDTFTGTGEVMAVHSLTEVLSGLGHHASVKRARLFTWDEALANNLIIVGGPAQSVVFLQLPQLESLALKSPDQLPFLGQEAVRNLKVNVGRPALYLPVRHRDNAFEYAIIALVPGGSSDHSNLITAGTNTFATQAAAKFLCEPKQIKVLLDRLKIKSGQIIPHFEALLRVEIRGGAPLEPQLMAVYRRSS